MTLCDEKRRIIQATFCGILLAFMSLVTGPLTVVQATEQGMFVVTDVAVDETAETAVAARSLAESAGRSVALTRLLKRLTPSSACAGLPQPEPNEILSLLKGHSVRQEKTSAVRYLGRLDFAFRAQAIRQLLENYDVVYAETRSTPVLILPIFRSLQGDILRTEDNPWYDLFLEADQRLSLVQFVVPYRELADMLLLSLQTALLAKPADLRPLAERYGTERVAYAIARLHRDNQNQLPNLQLEIIERNETGEETTVTKTIGSVPQGMIAERLATAFTEARIAIEDLWKERNQVRRGIESRVTVVVPITDYSAWLALGKSLDNVTGLRRWSVVQLGAKEAVIDLWTNGGIDQLRLALTHEDLQLAPGPIDWYLLPSNRATSSKKQLLTPGSGGDALQKQAPSVAGSGS